MHGVPISSPVRYRLLAGLTGCALALATPAVLGTPAAQATVTGPGVAPGHNITVTHDLDFVGVYGYVAGTTLVVEVHRTVGGEDVTIGRTVTPAGTTLNKGAIGTEINHGPSGSAAIMSACWDVQTPDIRPGDRVTVTAEGRTDEVTVDDVHWTGRPVEDPVTHDITVDGVARRSDGTAMPYTALDTAEFRNTTGKYRIIPSVIEPVGTGGGFRVHYRAPYTGFRNKELLSEAQRRAALLNENNYMIGFGDLVVPPPDAQIINGITDASGPALGCEAAPAGSAPLAPRDTTPPTVTDRAPADGAADVARSSDVTVTFSEPVTGADTGGFWLSSPTGTVPATVTVDPTARVATLHSDRPLASGTTYTAHVGDRVTDAGVNPLAASEWTFTTATSSDTTSPTLTASSPADGTMGVPVTSAVTATFSEPVTGVGATGFTVDDFFGNRVPAAVVYDPATRTATLTPTQPLDPGTPYTVSLGGPVADAAGNSFWAVSWIFTSAQAGAPADTAAPVVSARGPASAATGVPVGSPVTATFSEAVTGLTATSFTLTGPAGAVAATVGYDASTQVATLAPGASLTAGTSYTAALTGAVEDAAGNALGATTWRFTTAAASPAADRTAPVVSTRAPASAATAVPVGSPVTATFSEAVTGLTATSFTLTGPAGAVAATAGYDGPSRVATLTPGAPLTPGARYTVALTTAVKDSAGNALTASSWSFTTAAAAPTDTGRPTVTGGAPADGATGVVPTTAVTATFSEPVTGVAAGSLTLTGPSGRVAATVGYAAGTRTATLTPAVQLAAGTRYTVALSTAVKDSAGNRLAATTWSFTTAAAPPADRVAPTVTARTPAANLTGVLRASTVTVGFSEPVTGVGRATLTLSTGNGAAVAATVRYDGASGTATLDPTPTLKAGTRYRVTLTTGIRDAAGNRLAATTWTFTTGSR